MTETHETDAALYFAAGDHEGRLEFVYARAGEDSAVPGVEEGVVFEEGDSKGYGVEGGGGCCGVVGEGKGGRCSEECVGEGEDTEKGVTVCIVISDEMSLKGFDRVSRGALDFAEGACLRKYRRELTGRPCISLEEDWMVEYCLHLHELSIEQSVYQTSGVKFGKLCVTYLSDEVLLMV